MAEDEVFKRARAIVERRNARAVLRQKHIDEWAAEFSALVDEIMDLVGQQSEVPFYFDGESDFVAYSIKSGRAHSTSLVRLFQDDFEDHYDDAEDEDPVDPNEEAPPTAYNAEGFVVGRENRQRFEHWTIEYAAARDVAVEGILEALSELVADGHSVVAYERAYPPMPAAQSSPQQSQSYGCVTALVFVAIIPLLAFGASLFV